MTSSVKPEDIKSLQIFPPIRIARVGDSGFELSTGKADGDIEWFLPSEIPGKDDVPSTLESSKFRDSKQRIKRQAVLFHVYAYDSQGKILGEITNDDRYSVKWTVHVANAKGSFHDFRGMYREHPTPEPLRNPDVQGDENLDYHERTRLIVNPGPKPISGKNQKVDLVGNFFGSQEKPTEVNIGQIRTDDKGRLVFIGGAGYSRSVAKPNQAHFQPDIVSEFDSIDWVDDTCDGWIDVEVSLAQATGGPWKAAQKATVMSAPPKFAWGVLSPTSLYDLIENIYYAKSKWSDRAGWDDHDSQFNRDIWPVLSGSYGLSWVNSKANHGHGPLGQGNFLPLRDLLATTGTSAGNPQVYQLRELIFERLRKPNFDDKNQANTKFMPRLSGDSGDAIEPGQALPSDKNPSIRNIERFAALTERQYERFKLWSEGNFSSGNAPWNRYDSIDQVEPQWQPSFLTRAALEHTIGDPLYPGIEVYWVAKQSEIYVIPNANDLSNDDPPFRINHDKIQPGDLGRGLSLPWQSDFDQCNTHWWPSARPDDVIRLQDWDKATGNQKRISEDEFISKVGSKQRIWTRDLRDSPDYPEEYFPGSTDMVQFWQKLGFVVKQPGFAVTHQTAGDKPLEMPVFLEQERLKISRNQEHVVFTSPLNF